MPLVVFVQFFFFSCDKNDDLNKNEEIQCVIETYIENLQNGVDSVQLITNQHPVYIEAICSEYFIKSGFEIDDVNSVFGIYYYENGSAALLQSNTNGDKVFAYMFNAKTKEFVDAYLADLPIIHNCSLKSVTIDDEFTLVSLITGETLLSYSGVESDGLKLKSWGGCMRDAMKVLYDDWDDDPIGTLSCWMTGPLCVVGGGIACLIKN